MERGEKDGTIVGTVFKGMDDSCLGEGAVLSPNSKRGQRARDMELTFNSNAFEIVGAID